MELNARMIGMMADPTTGPAKMAIACHRGRVGWVLYHEMILKGSSALEEIVSQRVKLAAIRPSQMAFLAPPAADTESLEATRQMVAMCKSLGMNIRKVKMSEIQGIMPENISRPCSIRQIREEAETAARGLCVDNASALAVAVAMVERKQK
jgi:hypothetical protein